jgi:FkbH-like protein
VEGIEPYLKWRLYQNEIAPSISFGGFDTVMQDILGGAYKVNDADPDIIVLSLLPDLYVPDFEMGAWRADDVSESLIDLFDQLESRTDASVVLNTFPRPAYSKLGSTADGAYKVSRVNDAIFQYAFGKPSQFFVVDWEILLMTLGESSSYDRRFWYLAKAPFKPLFLDLYAKEIAKIGRALRGKNKKCLVLDCDNTLWGGIVGEDGLEGITLDRNEYPGNAYYDFQKSVLGLVKQGVVVALCSKNDEKDMWRAIDEHPHSLLKREHFAAHRINWDDKASNLESLARELNLGLDSIVFVDDSDFECGLIRQLLPEVTVRQVPKQLSEYPRLLRVEGLFDKLTYSDEDQTRTQMYRDESVRRTHSGLFQNVEAYLESLELRADIHPVREHEVQRVAQLTQKTNQFNLTTRRYTEGQIRAFAEDPNAAVLALSVQDRFGDSGLTGVLIAVKEGSRIRVDELLLSCRILGRRLEHAFVHESIDRLDQEWGPDEWVAEYIPTSKNDQVARFWDQFGFTGSDQSDGTRHYLAAGGQLKISPVPFISLAVGSHQG